MGMMRLLRGSLVMVLVACSGGGGPADPNATPDASTAVDAADSVADAAGGMDAEPPPDAAPTCATDCSELAGLCIVGVCNEDTDTCESQPAGDTAACDDGNPCRSGATCTAGACGGGTLVCDVPTALTTGTAAASPLAGTAMATSESLCPDGEVLVGLYGSHVPSSSQPTLFEWFQSAGAICAPLTWVWDPQSARYRVHHEQTDNMTEIGQHYPFDDWSRQCADDAVIVGVNAVEYSQVLTEMKFECATVTAAYVADAWVLEVGSPAALAKVGRGLGSLVNSDCAAGEIATGLRIGTSSTGNSATGISYMCSTPGLSLGR